MGVAGHGARGKRVEAGDVRRRSELREGGAGRLELKRGAVLVAEGATGQAHQHPRAGALVGRPQLLPDLPGAAEREQGSPGVSRGQLDRAAGVCRDRSQGATLVPAAIASSSSLASRAASRSPTASMIST